MKHTSNGTLYFEQKENVLLLQETFLVVSDLLKVQDEVSPPTIKYFQSAIHSVSDLFMIRFCDINGCSRYEASLVYDYLRTKVEEGSFSDGFDDIYEQVIVGPKRRKQYQLKRKKS